MTRYKKEGMTADENEFMHQRWWSTNPSSTQLGNRNLQGNIYLVDNHFFSVNDSSTIHILDHFEY